MRVPLSEARGQVEGIYSAARGRRRAGGAQAGERGCWPRVIDLSRTGATDAAPAAETEIEAQVGAGRGDAPY